MVGSRNTPPSWITTATKRVDFEENVDAMFNDERENSTIQLPNSLSDFNLGFGERALSAAGAAVISAIIVNPLDVAKTRLQAQAAGVPCHSQCGIACFQTNTMLPDLKSLQSSNRAVAGGGESVCPPECSNYRGTLDVFIKVIRQEGFSRLWRGTNASLTLAIPTVGIYLPCYDVLRNHMEEFAAQNAPSVTPYVPLVAGSVARSLACITCYPVELARTRMQAFKETHVGVKPPGVWKTLIEVISPIKTATANNFQNFQSYRVLWTGLGSQLARDVPFSAICWATLEPIRLRILSLVGDQPGVANILGANFCAGFVAGTLAAAATCPLDVARTRRQIEKDPGRQMRMTTRQTLLEIWRGSGWKGLFTGVGPRVARAGPSVGIVVSLYEVVKYALHNRGAGHNSI
ncbi:hypothetical protein Nepgr_002280 [Nepenthes gracilis]|uniref:Mitochondrial carrier protein MTM1 n=1 Tax=Nepenthes gracilis TaxID=150966 RepID=A0AAD3RY68_NEPGR|nr:hypothetical protein Nepgr_002280 [Nepenthes gracilis]